MASMRSPVGILFYDYVTAGNCGWRRVGGGYRKTSHPHLVRNHKPGLKYVDAGCVPDLSLTIV